MSEIDSLLKDAPEYNPSAGQSTHASAKPRSEVDDLLKDAPTQARGLKGWAGDIAATALKGAIGVPESLVGLADIPTGGRVGKFLENQGGAVGFRPKQAREFITDTLNSEATKEAQRKFQEADGVWEKTKTAVANPSLVFTSVGEALPATGLGGVVARGLMAGTRLGQMGAKGAALAGAAGEGIVGGGQAAEQIRQETKDGLLTPEQMGYAGVTGLTTAGFGALGGKIANRLGIGDVDVMLAEGANGMARHTAQDAASRAATAAANPLVEQAALKSIPTKVIQGAITEGLLEELPQSVSEQIFQNLALGDPWHKDVDSAVVLGTLSGGAMGAGAAGYRGFVERGQAKGEDKQAPEQKGQPDPQTPPAPGPGMQSIQQAFADQLAALQPQEQGEELGPQIAPPDGAAALAQQQAQAARDAEIAASRAVESPDDEIYRSTGATAPRPSEAMGLRSGPDAGPLENAAAMSVDTGATEQLQQADALAQAAEVAQKGKPAAQNQEQPAQAQQEVDPDTGVISGMPSMSDWSDVDLSTAFRNAQSKDVRLQLANELSRRRAAREEDELRAELRAEQAAESMPDVPDNAFARTQEDAGPVPKNIEIQGEPAQAPGANAEGANVATLAQLNRKKLDEMTDAELHQLSSMLPADHSRQQKIQKAIQNRATQAQQAINEGAKTDGTQADQAKQAVAQPTQTGGQAPAARDKANPGEPAATSVVGRVEQTAGLTDGAATAPKKAARSNADESVQDRIHREWRENYDRVVIADDLSNISTKDIERAAAYASRVSQIEKRKGWDGGQSNKALIDAADREVAHFKGELAKRRAAPAGSTQAQALTPDQIRRARLEREVSTGTTNNGGIVASLRPSAIEKRRQELADMGERGLMSDAAQGQAQSSQVEGLRQQLRDVETKILLAAPSRIAQGGGDIEAAMKSSKVPVTLKAQRKKIKDELRKGQHGSSSKAVQDFIDGKRDTAPTIEEVNAGTPDKAVSEGAEAKHSILAGKAPGDTLNAEDGSLYRVLNTSSDGKLVRLTQNPDQLSERVVLMNQERYQRLLAEHAAVKAVATEKPIPAEQPAKPTPTKSKPDRPQPGDPGYTLLDARNDLIDLRTQVANEGPVGDDRMHERMRRQEKLVRDMEADSKPAAGTDPAPQSQTVKIPAAIDEALTADMHKQQARVKRLRTQAESTELDLEGKKAAQLKVTAAETTLRKMRTSRFDAEDAVVASEKVGNPGPFAEFADFFPSANEALVQHLLASPAAPVDVQQTMQDAVSVDHLSAADLDKVAGILGVGEKAESKVAPAAAELSLDDQLKQVNDELANQGPVRNANTRAKRDQIRTAIAERDFPAILKAVDGDVDSAEAINQALQFAGDEPKAKVIERVLKNRGISEEYRQRWAERLMSSEGAQSAEPAPPTTPTPAKAQETKAKASGKKKPSADQTRAKADLMNALADLGDILGKNTRMNILPEQEQKLLPVLTRVLDAAFRLGYHKFKDAAKFALDQIREHIGAEAADALTLDHLQGAYIATGPGQGKDSKRAVIDVETKAEIEAHEAVTAADEGSTMEPGNNQTGENNERTDLRGQGPQALDEVAAPQGGRVEGERGVGAGRADGGQGGATAGGRADGTGLPAARGGRSGAGRVRAAETGARGESGAVGAQGTGGDGQAVSPADGRVAVPGGEASAPNVPAANFQITDDVGLGQGGEVQKFNDNLAAIRALKRIEADNRRATPDEQALLARYVGWGGLANAFPDPTSGAFKDKWQARGEELRGLLTAEEYKAARRSTRNAHYTSKTVVSAMWDAVRRLGYRGGLVLESSMGSGNFLGLAPQDLAHRFVGVEYDSLTARIGQALYPQATVLHAGFQKVPTPDNAFMLNIGNPPFGSESLRFQFKPELHGVSIHNQFFRAGMDALRPGGIQAMVVSRYLMDAKDTSSRLAMASKARLLGAIRLPDTAFKENARTEVVTDILFFQKLEPGEQAAMEAAVAAYRDVKARKKGADEAAAALVPRWVETVQVPDPLGGEAMTVNSHFERNPQDVLGVLERSGSMAHGADITVRLDKPAELAERLQKAIERLPQNVQNTEQQVLDATAARHRSLSDALRIAVANEEPGQVKKSPDGKLQRVIERETPEGGYEFAYQDIDERSPWSESLSQDADGHWYTMKAVKDEAGNAVKALNKQGKPTSRNLYEREVFKNEADIPDGLRLGKTGLQRLTGLVTLRDLLKRQLVLETADAAKAVMEGNRKALAQAYAEFVKANGPVNRSPNMALAMSMPDGGLVAALEVGYQPERTAAQAARSGLPQQAEQAEAAPILTERVVPKYEPATKAETPSDALAITLSERGRVDMERIAALLGIEPAQAAEQLQEGAEPLVFKDPETQSWETADVYLSGLVKRKLNAARAAGLAKNVEALEKVIPEDWTAENVAVQMGATWVPAEVYADFLTHLTGAPATVRFSALTNSFAVTAEAGNNASQWSSDGAPVDYIVTRTLNSKPVVVTYKDEHGNTQIDQEATALAGLKAREIVAEFGDWVFKDGERRQRLVDLFNEKFNTRVVRQYSGQHLALPGKVPDAIIKMRRHQMNAVWRGIYERFMLMDHTVGAGKTFTAIARAMERRRMGLSRKPMVAVPNHLVEQWAADVYRLYPGAKVLAAGKKDFEAKRRRRLFGKIATGDWDIVIVPHSSFGFIGIAQETEARYLELEMAQAQTAIEDAWQQAREDGTDGGRRKPFGVKEAERLAEKIQARMDRLSEGVRDRLLTFEQLGVDDLTVDEAHEFKNLYYSSNLTGVRGMGDKTGSRKANDLYNKVRVLREQPTGSVTFLTGTPISNSAVEMYTVLRYLAADSLKDMGLEHFDAFRSQFVEHSSAFEPTESGRLKEVTRLGRTWSNMRSLMDLYYQVTDAVSLDDIKQWYAEDNSGKAFPVPRIAGGKDRELVAIKPTPAQESALTEIMAGFDGLEDISDPYERNAERLRLMDRARKVSLDVRAVDPRHPSTEAGGKLQQVSENIKRIYDKWDADKGTQLVFLDRSVPKAKGDDKIIKEYDAIVAKRDKALAEDRQEDFDDAQEALDRYDANEIAELRLAQSSPWSAYQQIKDNLIAMGVPANEIRFVQEAGNDEQKAALFDAVNGGKVRVLIGSTQRMGAGTNVQQRAVALHHVDVTWKPSDIEQREGRVIRQGNKLLEQYGDAFEVEIMAYATERTVDAKMWDLNATKLRTINGIRKYKGDFTMDFTDEEAVGMAEMAALASGNPLLLERVQIESEIQTLEMQERAHRRKMLGIDDELNRARKAIERNPALIEQAKARTKDARARISAVDEASKQRAVTVDGKRYESMQDALRAAEDAVKLQQEGNEHARYAITIDGERVTSKDGISAAIGQALGDVDTFEATVDGQRTFQRTAAARAIADRVNQLRHDKDGNQTVKLGSLYGYELVADIDFGTVKGTQFKNLRLTLMDGEKTVFSADAAEIQSQVAYPTNSIRAPLDRLVDRVRRAAVDDDSGFLQRQMERAQRDLPELEGKAGQPFPKADELATKRARLKELVSVLDANNKQAPAASEQADDDDAAYMGAPDNKGAERQFRDTEKAYGGKPAYDDAKAAGKTKLTYGQWVHVRTPNFKNWFGDWESDPAHASKVVDRDTGEPLVVYHGTGADFTEFDGARVDQNYGVGDERGFFFTSKPGEADWAADHAAEVVDGSASVMPVFLDIKDPTRVEVDPSSEKRGLGDPTSYLDAHKERIMGWAEDDGRDGVHVVNPARGYGTYVAFDPEQVKSAVGNRGTFDGADARIDHFAARPRQQIGTPTDRAVMDMAREGQPARDILRLIADTSRSRFNRQVARLLLKTGITPEVVFADTDLGVGDGFKFKAKYSRAQDRVTLTGEAAGQAEQIVLHELIHAATLKALDKPGLHSLQMRRLFEHVKRQGGAAGQYGMKNVGEFVAEAFTNPEFQRLLRQMDAPAGGSLKSAWEGFVRILRSILGLPQDGHDALSRALEVGVAVMREDMGLRQRGERGVGGDAHFGAAELGRIKSSALDQINSVMRHPGKVSLWDKSVGTMRNLAERAPAFKPVYEAAQRFIDDVATMANDAADMAPRVLPRVDNWRDLAKKPINAADNKAVAKPLFEGTLLWARDANDKPVLVSDLEKRYANLPAEDKAQMMLKLGKLDAGVLKMWQGLPLDQFEKLVNSRFDGQMLKAGVVWSDKELADIFKATPNQISLYRETRKAIDRSIDMTGRADMLRVLGEDFAGLRDAVLEQDSLGDAMEFLISELTERQRANPDDSRRLTELHNSIVDRAEKARDLMTKGYAPLSRFGRYTVDVVDAGGERQYFGMYESKADSNRAAMQMRAAFPGATVTQGTMSQQAYKLFAGITPESLELFGNMLGLDEEGGDARDKAFQEYLKLTKNNHSALKRLIHRQGIAGFSEDVGRVLASFVYSNARQAAGALNAGTLERAVNDIPKEQGELKDVAMGLREYIRDPQEEGQAVRGMLFAQYLGGSVASAFVNMTQPFAVTMPWLSQYGGIKSAGAHLAKALKDMGTKGFKYEADLAAALKHAENDGVVSPQEIHQLMAQARGSGSLRSGDGTKVGEAKAAAANTWERTKVAWGQPFALAEQFNRRSTFIAAYRIAKEQKMADPAAFARRAVEETQFVYSKANKSRWMRGTIGGTLMTFKSYSIQYLELLHRMWTQGGPEGKRAVGWAMATLMLMGGAGGLPFMEDLEDLIDGIAQLMGYNVSSKQWRQRALRDVLGKELAEFMEQGVSGLPGAPVDVSGRLGLGNLIPGTGLLLQKPNRERDLLEIAGPAGDLIKRGFTGGRKLLTGDVGGAALEVSPTAVRNAAKGADMAASGMYKDAKGYKVIDTTLGEALAKAGGFQPRSVAQVQEANSFMMRSRSFYQQNSAEIKAQWADALFRKDEAALERVRERLAAWNRDNPDQRMVVAMPDVWKKVREMGKDRTERIAATSPKALRQQMREMAAEAR